MKVNVDNRDKILQKIYMEYENYLIVIEEPKRSQTSSSDRQSIIQPGLMRVVNYTDLQALRTLFYESRHHYHFKFN